MDESEAAFVIETKTVLNFESQDQSLINIVKQYKSIWKLQTKMQLIASDKKETSDSKIELIKYSIHSEEAYDLDISKIFIAIKESSSVGFYRALTTFAQLLSFQKSNS